MKGKLLKKSCITCMILTSILVFTSTFAGCSDKKKSEKADSKVTSESKVDEKEKPKVTQEAIKPTKLPTETPTPTPTESFSTEEESTPQADNPEEEEGKTSTQTPSETVTAQIQVYAGTYFDDGVYGDSNMEGYSKNYCEVIISNVTDSSFDFTVYDCNYNTEERKLIFRTHTAEFIGDGTEAAFYGKEYNLKFTFPDNHSAHPAATDMEISGFHPLDGHTYVNNDIPEHGFG